jgi:photolyase PhrII
VSLPPHLDERVTRLSQARRGDGIVYWMRTAVRGHDNPALDVAVHLANTSGQPLLVYHAISERYPYASDRHHTFLLEGAHDVADELEQRGIPYALHVERPGHRTPHLRDLAARASVVITEDMPVQPLLGWTRRLAAAFPVWVVDTACVVPMPLVGKAHTRAFAFRSATEPLRGGRLEREWVDVAPRDVTPLAPPFEPLDPRTVDIPELVASCEIDHAVGPVPHTRGGSKAGYARWAWFRERGLRSYSARRNNAADPYGVSRMSPYLHMGFVSPLRIAREVASTPGKSADKFLDELLVWRELAYAYCRYLPDHDTVDTLPKWARATLRRHQGDPRPALYSWETLARARTGDRLWDAAQRSLLIHGELHNNVRMTWGKAVPMWTPDAESALAMLIDLNHRYALDGRDPSSYGGILWCLGGLDRPFKPAKPVLGEVRPRPTSHHARRLDLGAYEAHTSRPLRADPPAVCVEAAGIAGLAAARVIADHGYTVHVDSLADHAPATFTASDDRFARYVDSWFGQGRLRSDGRTYTGDVAEILAADVTPGTDGERLHLADTDDVQESFLRGVAAAGRLLGRYAAEAPPRPQGELFMAAPR